ncbi:flavin-containing monooxygenase [Roseicella aerolata]|uniref:NAD(P)-binding domain-containing protein n=1 Tax=Roseicella aerolata TaxID=2883479 RepID=A0A9X1L9M2_9PROT|nr:NAD(P)-binding domain-containing protein [Roseicella aerolata]MCB4823884.1 NAD(P)-binding domain-containing protein [Roseicella aerolata]
MNHIAPAASALAEADAVRRWLGRFEAALQARDRDALAGLFAADSHWRDLLALTWGITPHKGAAGIAGALCAAQERMRAHGFRIAEDRTPPRRVRRLGIEVIEAIFSFETALGRGDGVVRLHADDPARAWVLLTSLEALTGFEERTGANRPSGEAYSRNFGGDNWQDQRERAQSYADRDPAVLVIGGGQAGLAVAARLGLLGVDTLVVEKHARIGDNWRRRYHSLALHNQIHVNHLPYMPYPPHWPKYIPKDMLAGWFEAYAWAMEINAWTSTEFLRGAYDEAAGCWTAVLRRADGTERIMRPRHLIFANGVSGIPKIPSLPGLEDFRGEVIHSHAFTSGAAWKGRRALVLGTGNSGHDVAQDLHSHGAETSIIQRGSTTVVSIDPSAKLNYALYDEGPPLEDCDLIATAATYPLLVRGYQLAVQRMVELDKDLIAALKARGFRYDIGEDGTGHQMKYRRRGGGYYLDAGCSGLIIRGEIGLLQFDDIERFVPEGALMRDGRMIPAELLVLATGYHTQQELVRRLLGEAVAEKVGPIWGFGADGEMANMWKPTAQKGLWFMAGSLAQCRIYSKTLALQIKAREAGLIGG